MKSRFDLVCFDVDGTLVRHPTGKVIWEVLNHRFTGDDAINRERHRKYKKGKITYDEWVALDVQGWIDAGANREQITATVREFDRLEGVSETLSELRGSGTRMAVVSGTLDVVIDTVFPEQPFDDVYSNQLVFDAGDRLVSWKATRYDQEGKAGAVRELCARHGIDPERTAFVGDGENDVSVLGVAGFVIAFNATSQRLAAGADLVLENTSMTSILDALR